MVMVKKDNSGKIATGIETIIMIKIIMSTISTLMVVS